MGLTTRIGPWFPFLCALWLLAACASDDPQVATPTPGDETPSVSPAPTTATPTETAAPETECPNQIAIADDPARQIGPSSSADVDGDGGIDEVKLASDSTGSAGCRFFVAVEKSTGEVLSSPAWEIGSQGGLPQPTINGFADVDGRGGVEIVVDEAAGASSQFVGVFMVVDGGLERVTLLGRLDQVVGPGVDDLFAYGGSVGHVEAVDCAASEEIVVSTAVPSSDPAEAEQGIYEVTRYFLGFDGAILERDRVEDERVPIDQLDRFNEFSASPFGSC